MPKAQQIDDYRRRVDTLIERVPEQYRLDFLNFVLEGQTSPSFQQVLDTSSELQQILEQLMALVEESFSAVIEVSDLGHQP